MAKRDRMEGRLTPGPESDIGKTPTFEGWSSEACPCSARYRGADDDGRDSG